MTAATAGRTVVLVGGFDGIGPQREVWASRDGRHFHAIATLPQPVRYPAVVADANSVYVLGGLISGGEYNGQFSNLIQRVHLGTHPTTTIAGRMPMALAHAMSALIDGRILVIGGSTPHGPSSAILRFDPARRHVALAGGGEPVLRRATRRGQVTTRAIYRRRRAIAPTHAPDPLVAGLTRRGLPCAVIRQWQGSPR